MRTSVTADNSPSQYYTGLIADLYEPLAQDLPEADAYVPFLEHSGSPVLEIACGAGNPMLELIERGFDVDGLDASQDMLDLCRARAKKRVLQVTLHLAEMQSFALERRYRSIFLAGASFTLMTTDAAAASALGRIHAHLEPGGSTLIPLETLDVAAHRKALGRFRETKADSGDRLRVGLVALDVSPDERDVSSTLRYERIPAAGEPEVVERAWVRRWWSQDQFREMLRATGFGRVSFVSPACGRAAADASIFVALAQRQ